MIFIALACICSELKRRMKLEQKTKEKAEKEALKPEESVAVAGAKPAKKVDKLNEEEISPNEYFKLRSIAVTELKKNEATHPYPHKFHVSSSLESFIEKYSNLKDGEMLENEPLK